MLNVVFNLFLAVAVSFIYGSLHTAGYLVAIEDGLAVYVSGSSTDGLNQCSIATQKTLFVGIEYSH